MNKLMEKTDGNDEIRRCFDSLDQNMDGYISFSELRLAFFILGEKNLTDDEINQMIKEADADKDGLIDYTDFLTIITSTK